MSIVVYFKHFDPIAGKLSARYDYMFAELAFRARKLLDGRSINDVNTIAQALTNIHLAKGYKDPFRKAIKGPSIRTTLFGKETDIAISSNEVEGIYNNIPNISLSEISGLPNGKWHELFAVLTLFYMEKVQGIVNAQERWEPLIPNKWLPGQFSPNPFPRLTDEAVDRYAHEWLLLAQQAITFAETLFSQEEMVRNIRSQESSNAAKKRHKNLSGELKAIVIQQYLNQYQTRSYREAARRIFADLILSGKLSYDEATGKTLFEGKDCLQTDDPEKRFEVWIGKHFKDKNKV